MAAKLGMLFKIDVKLLANASIFEMFTQRNECNKCIQLKPLAMAAKMLLLCVTVLLHKWLLFAPPYIVCMKVHHFK